MHASRQAELAAEVNAVNLANGYANELLPLLQQFFTPLVGQKIIKQDGTLLAKLQSKLPEFPKTTGRPGQHQHATIMTYRLSSDYSLAWTVKVCWPIPPHGCTYFERTVYVGEFDKSFGTGADGTTLKAMTNHGDPWPTDYNLQDVLDRIAAYEQAKKDADNAKSKVYPFEKFIR